MSDSTMPTENCASGCPHYFSADDAGSCPFGQIPTTCPCIGLEQRGWLLAASSTVFTQREKESDDIANAADRERWLKDPNVKKVMNALTDVPQTSANWSDCDCPSCKAAAEGLEAILAERDRLLEDNVKLTAQSLILLEPIDAEHVGEELDWLRKQDGNVGAAALQVMKAFAQKNAEIEKLIGGTT